MPSSPTKDFFDHRRQRTEDLRSVVQHFIGSSVSLPGDITKINYRVHPRGSLLGQYNLPTRVSTDVGVLISGESEIGTSSLFLRQERLETGLTSRRSFDLQHKNSVIQNPPNNDSLFLSLPGSPWHLGVVRIPPEVSQTRGQLL